MSLQIKDSRATVFEPVAEEKFIKANLSTSKKNPTKESGYENMSWRARFVGDAFEKGKELSNGTRIEIKNALIENNYDKENGKLWVTVVVFDFEILE